LKIYVLGQNSWVLNLREVLRRDQAKSSAETLATVKVGPDLTTLKISKKIAAGIVAV